MVQTRQQAAATKRNDNINKRKRSDTEDFTKECETLLSRQELSPASRKQANALYKRARNGRKDLSESKAHLAALSRSADKNIELKKFDEMKAREARRNWLLDVGEWCGHFTSRVKHKEQDVQKDETAEFKKLKQEQGLDKKAILRLVDKSGNWQFMCDQHVQDFYPMLETDVNAVKQWRQGGEKPANAPKTPHLKRLDSIMAVLNKDRVIGKEWTHDFILQLCRVYADRNNLAHWNLPKPSLHYDSTNEKVDWKSIWKICQEKMEAYTSMKDDGTISEDELQLSHRVVKHWFQIFVEGWDVDGNPVDTIEGKKEVSKLAKYYANPPKPGDTGGRRSVWSEPYEWPFQGDVWEHYVPKTSS